MCKHCVYDEPLKPYYCEADWNCVDCPNHVEEEEKKIDDLKKESKHE